MPEPTAHPAARLPDADLAVVGAGPAGLSGAIAAADAGCRVAVLDLGTRPGGQYWRHTDSSRGLPPAGRHHGWRTFTTLRERFESHRRAGRIAYLPGHAVWQVQGALGEYTIRANAGERDPRPRTLRAATVLIATGAHDRHVPFPGWTLPGVMAVGGAQALLKGSDVLPGGRVVVAGTGPFLLSVADGLLRAGAEVVAVVEASRARAYARQWRAVAAVPEKLAEAAGYAATLARHRVPYLTGHAVTHADGPDHVRSVRIEAIDRDWHVRPDRGRWVECDTLAVGYGFVAQLELLLELGCVTRLDAGGSLVVQTDARQQTTVTGAYAAGEPTGVGGADLAVAEGALAGNAAAEALGRPHAAPSSGLRRTRRRLRGFARALSRAHPVSDGWQSWSAPDTLVCRCEEVSLAEIRTALTLGAQDARAVKLLARPGMGWCQGRICGPAVAALVASAQNRAVTAEELRGLARRPLAQPVPLGALAAIDAANDLECDMSHRTAPFGGAHDQDRGDNAR